MDEETAKKWTRRVMLVLFAPLWIPLAIVFAPAGLLLWACSDD